MLQKIHLTEVLRLIDQSIEGTEVQPFQITFCLYDGKKNTAGRKKTIQMAAKYHGERGILRNKVKAEAEAEERNEAKIETQVTNHYSNQTRNIVDMQDDTKHPYKVHIRLIIEFNQKFVYW